MSIKVLGISCSPRKDGNSDTLLKEALRGATEAGAETEYVRVRDLNLSPCEACGYCDTHGVCRLDDDYPSLLSKMLEADLLIFATPIYFMAVSAWGKIVIDRCQQLWAKKYKLKLETRDPGRPWAGMVIAVGGSRSVKMFESVRLTLKYFYDVLEIRKKEEAFYNGIDEKGDVLKHPGAIADVFEKVKKIVKSIEREKK